MRCQFSDTSRVQTLVHVIGGVVWLAGWVSTPDLHSFFKVTSLCWLWDFAMMYFETGYYTDTGDGELQEPMCKLLMLSLHLWRIGMVCVDWTTDSLLPLVLLYVSCIDLPELLDGVRDKMFRDAPWKLWLETVLIVESISVQVLKSWLLSLITLSSWWFSRSFSPFGIAGLFFWYFQFVSCFRWLYQSYCLHEKIRRHPWISPAWRDLILTIGCGYEVLSD